MVSFSRFPRLVFDYRASGGTKGRDMSNLLPSESTHWLPAIATFFLPYCGHLCSEDIFVELSTAVPDAVDSSFCVYPLGKAL